MRQPISRDRQIELAKNYESRVEQHVDKLLRVPVIREIISRPTVDSTHTVRPPFTVKSVRAAKCV